MTIAELLHQLAERVDFNASDDVLKAIVTNPTLSQIQVPSELATDLNRKLMTESEAKINGNIKKHFTATALNGVDAKVKEILDEFGFDDDSKNGIFAEQNSYNRIKLLAQSISDLKDKSITATGGEKKALIDKINELTTLVNSEKSARANDIASVNAQWASKLTDKEINAMFGNYDYAMDLDKEIQIQTARNVWERELKNKGGKYVYGEDGLKLVNAETPDLPFTIDNKQVDVKQFTEGVLAQNKLLKVTKAPVQGAMPTQAPQPISANTTAKSQVSKALADFRAGAL
jgi:hypothetical protein